MKKIVIAIIVLIGASFLIECLFNNFKIDFKNVLKTFLSMLVTGSVIWILLKNRSKE